MSRYSSLLPLVNSDESELIDILGKEIEWNESRKITKVSIKISPIIKWSLVIGIIAAVVKVGSSHTNTMHGSSLIESLKKVLST